MAATLLGLRIGGSESVELSYMHLAVAVRRLISAEQQRVSRQLASLVNTFTNYDDVKRGVTKNSERVSGVTLCMSGFPKSPLPVCDCPLLTVVREAIGCQRIAMVVMSIAVMSMVAGLSRCQQNE
jgi:hypothetical protein